MRERITSRDLAEQMAYAEAPLRDLAALAVDESMRLSMLQDAEALAVRAGHRYLDGQRQALLSYGRPDLRPKSEDRLPVEEDMIGAEVYFGRDDLMVFARRDREEKAAKTIVTATWNLLGRTYAHRQVTGVYHDDNAVPVAERNDSPLKYHVEPGTSWRADTATLEVRSLVLLLRRFDDAQRRNPKLQISDFFGSNWGPGRIAFLEDFLRYKLDQIAVTVED